MSNDYFERKACARYATLLLTVTLVGCASGVQNPQIAYDPPEFTQPDAVVEPLADQPYRLSALDKFLVTIYRVPDLSREYTVEPSGIVNFPLIGEITVVGMTSNELANVLTERYNRSQLRNPSISVQITQMTTRTVTVEGAVRNPTSFNLVGQSNLIEAIARAGGPGEFANEQRIVVFRQIGGQRQAAAFDLRKVREGLTTNPAIYPGDIVVVDGSELRQNFRQLLYAIPLLGIFRPF